MDIKVTGGQKLSGEITPSGSKNSAVCLIPATLLFDQPITLQNVPEITDVDRLLGIMHKLGSKIDWDKEKKEMIIDNSKVSLASITKEDLGNMKGTSLFWGPMLARFRKVDFRDLPGGCTLGMRPLDAHYLALSDMGVKIDESDGVLMDATKAEAKEIWLAETSPTATENAVMLAVSLKGETRIVNAASEPNVQDLCNFLVNSGAKIDGIGSNVLEIVGGNDLNPVSHTILSDHYEIATFLALGAVTQGSVTVKNAIPQHFKTINREFNKFGYQINYEGNSATIEKFNGHDGLGKTISVKAQPWPALPVDMLPLFIPLALSTRGKNYLFHNWMFEAGLFWTSELQKLGANVVMCDPHRVIVTGGNALKGAILEAPYIIRAVVALVMAAMVAEGETTILNADALYRGHPHFSENLKRLGAQIEEIE